MCTRFFTSQLPPPAQDSSFPSDAASLGGAERGKDVVWLTLEQIFELPDGVKHELDLGSHLNKERRPVRLFSGDIGPEDIKQGGIGNCWMMSALACLATVPGAVQACFVTKQYNAHGKYIVRMWDTGSGRWHNIAVSDRCVDCVDRA